MLVTVIRLLGSVYSRFAFKADIPDLFIQLLRLETCRTVNGPVGNSPSSNRVICLVIDP